jgi:hypothetical protein
LPQTFPEDTLSFTLRRKLQLYVFAFRDDYDAFCFCFASDFAAVCPFFWSRVESWNKNNYAIVMG